MFHRLTTGEGAHNLQHYVFHGERMFGPFEEEADARGALATAAAAVAVRYAGLDCTAEEALDESFGASDATARDHRADLYHLAFYNLLDGAEATIIEELQDRNADVFEHFDYVCFTCGDEWTGDSDECFNCTQNSVWMEDEDEDEDDCPECDGLDSRHTGAVCPACDS